MLELVVATSNPHKVEEIRAVLDGVAGLRVLGLDDVVREKPGLVLKEPEEIGTTFEENATIKALSYAAQTGRLGLADDSGLEVDALGGKPGVISSHYCTDGREAGMSRSERDAKNNERVMRELQGVAAEKRTARFVCVMVVADGGKVLHFSRGTFEGRIGLPGDVPRGANGFGYDPLFLVAADEFKRTGAGLLPEEKNRLSHRGMALRGVAKWLEGLRG
jgi:XTP/dITP diphosphohydrolase